MFQSSICVLFRTQITIPSSPEFILFIPKGHLTVQWGHRLVKWPGDMKSLKGDERKFNLLERKLGISLDLYQRRNMPLSPFHKSPYPKAITWSKRKSWVKWIKSRVCQGGTDLLTAKDSFNEYQPRYRFMHNKILHLTDFYYSTFQAYTKS